MFFPPIVLKDENGNIFCFDCGKYFESLWDNRYGVVTTFCDRCFEGKTKKIVYELGAFEREKEIREEQLKDLKKQIREKEEELSSLWEKINFGDKFWNITSFLLGILFFYTVFHGHRLGIDCWLCKYRGVMAVVAFCAFLFGEEIVKEISNFFFKPASKYLLSDDEVSIISRQSTESSQSAKSDDEEPKSDDPRVNFARKFDKKDEK